LVRGKVVGSLSFHGNAAPTQANLHSYEAFACQVSLTLENATLLESLSDQVEELREARHMVSASHENVRREIAETLHGPVQTQLLVADFGLRQAIGMMDVDPGQAKAAIEIVRGRLDHLREREIREVSQSHHPSVIKLGLGPAVRSLADRYRPALDVRTAIDARLDGAASRAGVELPMDVRLVAYRMVEEALTNASRHGHARTARVAANLDAQGALVLEVADDGQGFEPATLTPGLGLQMIAMQVLEADGSWSIVSAPGEGSKLTVTLPLRSPVAAQMGQVGIA
jgi:signal transduction histidine kinase